MYTYTIQVEVLAETNSGAYFFQILVELNLNAHLFLTSEDVRATGCGTYLKNNYFKIMGLHQNY
jgi:hypothetical protein